MKKLFMGIGVLSFVAAIAMYVIGNDSSHLSELKDFFWVPLPLGVVGIMAGLGGKKKD